MTSSNSFYVTLFSNESQEIYNKLSRTIDLGTSPNWEVGVCEVSCSSPLPEYLNTVDVTPCADHAMIYCNLISPQFVGDSTVRCLRTIPNNSGGHHVLRNVQYVPVEQRQIQSIRFEFLTLEELHVPFKDSTTPTNVVLHFRKNYQWEFLLYNIVSASLLTHS
jgi:hypothetical protein